MRKLTIKDFLTFYSPCMSCKQKTTLSWFINYKTSPQTSLFPTKLGEFSPNINGKTLEIDLKVTYYNKFSLMIDMVSHNFISSEAAQFLQLIGNNNCYLQLKCVACNSQVHTNHLEWDSNRRLLKPLTIKGEIWHILDQDNYYHVYTNMDKNESEIIIDAVNAVAPLHAWQKIITALPINRFSSTDEFLERIKTYMVFG